MKTGLIFLIVFAWSSACVAQSQATTIRVQAMDMAKALLRKDYNTFAGFMHPKVITMAGGKQNLIVRMDTMNAVAAQLGASIKKVLIGNPGNIITYKHELQTTLPQFTELESAFGNITLESTLIAISADNGKKWYFIDTSVYNIKEVKKAMPDLSPELVIPPSRPPKITPAKQ